MEIAAFCRNASWRNPPWRKLPDCPASEEVAKDIAEEVIHIPALIMVFPVTAIRALIEAGIGRTAIWAGMAELVIQFLLFRVA